MKIELDIDKILDILARANAMLVMKTDPVTKKEAGYFKKRQNFSGSNFLSPPRGKSRDVLVKRLLDEFGTDKKVNEAIRRTCERLNKI